MKNAIFIGFLIALFVFNLSPKKFSGESLNLTILLSAICAIAYLISLLKKDQNKCDHL